MNEDLALKILAQSPSAAVVIVVVVVFRFLSKEGRENRKLWREMHDENMEARRYSRDIIEKCVVAFTQFGEIIRNCPRQSYPN